MKHEAASRIRGRSALRAWLVLVSAVLLSSVAGWHSVRFWARLPSEHVERLEPARLKTAFERVNRRTSAEIRTAFALRQASTALFEAYSGAAPAAELPSRVTASLQEVSNSQVGRLQQAAARLWLLEQAGVPVDQWWPSLRAFLEGMGQADFAHHQQALIAHWTQAYEAMKLGPGTAYGMAERLVGHPHGPFLQRFTRSLRTLIADRERAGDRAAVETCRALLYRLLRQWALEPGPAGLRLLAAETLADALEADTSGRAAIERQTLIQNLRAWRSAYRQAALARPVAILAPHPLPALAPAAHERLVDGVAFVTWLASAALAMAVLSIVLAPVWLPRVDIGARRMLLHSAAGAALLLAGGLLLIRLYPDFVREELRADWSSFRYWWWHPFLAAGASLLIALVSGLLQRSGSHRKCTLLARLGVAACGTWLMLAILLWSAAIEGECARRDYERQTRAAYDDTIVAMIGPESELLLEPLRRWQP